MLVSLAIRNFVLIEDAEMLFGPGLTVLTGETGAGKTLLTRALGLLVGERAEDGLVGPKSDDATVQAVFEIDPSFLAEVPEEIRELTGIQAGELIVTRRLSRQGRNRCFVNDSAVTLAALGEIVSGLLSFSGQHEHRRLLDPEYQLTVLDEWAGPGVVELARSVEGAVAQAHATERRLVQAEHSRDARLREIELLRFQVAELTDAALSEVEEGQLLDEQRLLARAEDVLRHAGTAADLLASDDDQPDAMSLAAQAAAQLAQVSGVDRQIDELGASLAEAHIQLAELSRELHRLLGGIAVDPARLKTVDERLRTYTDLARKYGGDTRAAMAYLEEAAGRLDALERVEEDMSALVESRTEQIAAALALASELSLRRKEAAPRLEAAARTQLAELGMRDASLLVVFSGREGRTGLRHSGAESVEFKLAANPGRPHSSLARTASGGELSRVLLALKCSLAGAGGRETLILDEVDAGIGGRTATAVGRKIKELAAGSQVVVVTHLAQVAALADNHYVVDKITDDVAVATRLTHLEAEAVVEELCRMMGGSPDDVEAMAHARELRERATLDSQGAVPERGRSH